MVTAYVAQVRTLGAVSRGDFDAAFRHAEQVSPAGQLAEHAPNALWLIMETVEAAARSGRENPSQRPCAGRSPGAYRGAVLGSRWPRPTPTGGP